MLTLEWTSEVEEVAVIDDALPAEAVIEAAGAEGMDMGAVAPDPMEEISLI